MTASLLDLRAVGVNGRSCSTSGTADEVEGAVRQVVELNTEPTAAVNDFVRISITTPSFVDVATNNTDGRPVVGMIIEKLTATTARVAVSGIFPDSDATTQGIVYLSATGRLTSTPPGPGGYLQRLGYSFGNGEFDLKPEKNMVFLT